MDMTKEQRDNLSLEITTLGLELGDMTPAQCAQFGKSLTSSKRDTRLVVKRDARFGPLLKKSQRGPRPATPSQEITQPAAKPLTHDEIFTRLQKAAADGQIEWALAGRFCTQPEIALRLVPYDVHERYRIPWALTDAVAKSGADEDGGLSRAEIGDRLLRAVQCGEVEPQMLGMFAAHPDRALRAIPDHVRKSYGIPATLGNALRKSYAPASSGAEVYGRLVDAIIARDLSAYFRTRWWREGRRVLRDIPESTREQYGLPSE